MRKFAVLTFVTLDSVMQATLQAGKDTFASFSHGGWTLEYYKEVIPAALAVGTWLVLKKRSFLHVTNI